jgi:type III secretory pathway component EscV
MTTPEILLLIFAIVLLGFSFVLVDKDKKSKNSVYQNGMEKPELSEEEIKALKDKIKTMLEDEVSNAVIDADDKMSKISNEKIMAVNDFSNQLLEKIEQNNNEVVFLYNMMTQKEDDIKTTFTKMDTIRRENKEFLEKLTTLMANKNRTKEQAIKKDNTANESLQKVNPEKLELKEELGLNISEEDDGILFIDEAIKSSDSPDYHRNDEILKMYKEKKTILEISKILNLGQGEVKLVIDLYAKK